MLALIEKASHEAKLTAARVDTAGKNDKDRILLTIRWSFRIYPCPAARQPSEPNVRGSVSSRFTAYYNLAAFFYDPRGHGQACQLRTHLFRTCSSTKTKIIFDFVATAPWYPVGHRRECRHYLYNAGGPS